MLESLGSSITRESNPSFIDLVSMLVVEERNIMEDTNKGKTESEGQALYNSVGRGRSRGRGRFGSARTYNNYQGRGQQNLQKNLQQNSNRNRS